MTSNELNLGKLFQTVGKVLLENQGALDEADTHNHDHGSNMVKIFKLASQAARQKKDAPPAQQLEYVSEQLQSKIKSGSAQLYADGFSRAAQQFKSQDQIQPADIMPLLQALMGSAQGTQQGAAPADQLSALLGSLGGGLAAERASQQASAPDEAQGGLDMSNILAAGMAFLQSRQRGENTSEALLNALISGSQMSSSPARAQSGKLVASALLQAIGAMGK